MQTEDEVPFTALMADVMNAYWRAIDRGQVELYFNVLAGYPFAAVAEALYAHMGDPDTGQYFPKPADVVRHIQGGKNTRALAAWDEALKAVEQFGAYATVTFPDPLIRAVIDRMGGWEAFCTSEEEQAFRQREFIERYSSYTTHPPTDIPAALVGQHEQRNRALGWGEDERAKEQARPHRLTDPKPPVLPEARPALPSGEEKPAPPKPVPGMARLGEALPIPKYLSEGEAAEAKARQKAELAARFATVGKAG